MLRLQAPLAYSPELGGYLVTRYDTVAQVLADDGRRFSSAAFASPVPNIFMTDDPDHARYRTATVRHLTSRFVRSLEPYVVAQAATFVDAFAGEPEVDLLEALAYPLPIRVVCHVLGIPESDSGAFHAWSAAVFSALTASFSSDSESHRFSFPDLAEMGLYFSALMDFRRRTPGPDIISSLVNDPDIQLDDAEILMLAITLTLAGHVTTATTLGTGMRVGLERPDIWDSAARGGRWDRFTDEVLRFESAAPTVLRRVVTPVTLEGVGIDAGSFLFCHLESANHDADLFPDPDTFRLDRDGPAHLTFGAGQHFCIGSVLARMESRVSFAALGPVLPQFVLAPDGVEISGETGRRVLKRLVVRRRGTSSTAMGSRIIPIAARRAGSTLKALAVAAGQAGPTSLAAELAELRGVVLKIGQLLSFLELPGSEAFGEAFTRLRDNAVPRPIALMSGQLAELGSQRGRLDVQPMAVAAASIGQVHRGILDGRTPVAVKLQFPDAASNIRADLSNAKLMARFLGSMMRLLGMPAGAIDTTAIIKELSERIGEELDYRQEARRQAQFAQIHLDTEGVRVPVVYPEVSTRQVLVMEWADGLTWSDAIASEEDLRSRWGVAIFRFVFGSLYGHGLFNADPHPGNYLFGADGSVTFLDFGCVKEVGSRELTALITVDRCLREHDLDGAEAALGLVGIRAASDRLRSWLETLYEPLTSAQPYRYTRDYGRRLFDEYTALLRSGDAGEIAMPAGLTLLNRINLGVHSILGALGATADWRAILDALIPDTLTGVAADSTYLKER
ncbi:MAG: cytochrome P450 [Dermatophilaceae bacterium]